MAKHSDGGSDKGRVKFRVIEFELEGGNQTLRESIRDIVGAIGRGQVQTRTQLANPAHKNGGGKDAATDDAIDVADFGEGETTEECNEYGESPAAPKKPRVLRTPQVLDDLDLNAGKVSLRDFLEKLNQESDLQRYASIAYWLKTVAKVDEVKADHIHTGYKRMKWATPADASSPLRQLKGSAYGWMSKGSKAGFYKINHVGEGHVEAAMTAAGIDLDA